MHNYGSPSGLGCYKPPALCAGDGELPILGKVAVLAVCGVTLLVILLVEEGFVDLGRAACRLNLHLLAAV